MKKMKNNTNASKVWCGVEISPNSYYTLLETEYAKWSNDDDVITDLTSGDLIINDGSNDITIISNAINFLKDIQQLDSDGSVIIRPKAAKKGWVFGIIPLEFTTSKLNSVFSKLPDNTNRSGITYKIYDSNDSEITNSQNEVDAVKTVIDFEPTYDYELIGGQIQQHTKPTTDIRLWVVAVPDISVSYGGSKEMVGGVNLKFIDPADKVNADGRVSKYMTYNATNHTNKMRLIIRHDAGVQHDLIIFFDIFRA